MEKGLDELRKHVIDPNKIEDIFIHQWFSDSLIGTKFQSSQTTNNGKWGSYRKDTVQLLSELNPKKMLIEPPIDYPHLSHTVGDISSDHQRLAGCFESMKKSVLLAGMEYDVIVRTRIDVHYDDSVFIRNVTPNAVYVCGKYQPEAWIQKIGKKGMMYSLLTDFFMWGNPDTMNKMGMVFDHLEELNTLTASPHGEHYSGYLATVMNKFQIIPTSIPIFGILRDSSQ